MIMFLRHNQRSKKQEREVLKQGIDLPTPVAANPEPLPPSRKLPPSLDTGVDQEKHHFDMPANTAGQSTNQRSNVPKSAGQSNVRRSVPLLPNLQLPSPSFVVVNRPYGPAPVISAPVPASTLSYRKRKEHEEKTGVVPTKRYKARVGASQCSKCQADRTPATGHKQYFGNWFCPNTATETYEEWRVRMADKRYNKEK